MNIIKKLSNLFSKTKFFFGGNSLITGMELQAPSTKDYLESFRASSLVHSCTKKIGEKMSTIEYELYQLRGLKANYIEQHEVLDLLAKPNSLMSGSQLVEITSIYLSLLGDCYWYKTRNARGEIIELWLMRPDLVSVVPAKDGTVVAYKFRSGGTETSYPAEDVIHFKESDPLSDYYGYSATKAAMEVIRADVYAKKWNTRFFYNSARPDAILTTEQEVGKEDRNEIRENWVQKYGGWENAQKVAVLSHGLQYKQVSVTQKDMDFANMRIANRDDILMALGVPKSVIGVTDDVNRCHDDKTEILTKGGWKFFEEIKDNEIVATYNKDLGRVEYQKIKEKHKYDFNGKLIEFKTVNTDLLVTPNHRIYAKGPDSKEYRFYEAIDVPKKSEFLASAYFEDGKEIKEIVIDETKKIKGSNNLAKNEKIIIDNIPAFISYLGWFLSEGGMLKKGNKNFRYIHTLCQHKDRHWEEIDDCLKKLPFKSTKYLSKDGVYRWNIYGKNINEWMRKKCGDGAMLKKIPREFLELKNEYLAILFNSLMKGDGSWDKRENRTSGTYATISNQLADDVMELALKLGYCASKSVAYEKDERREKLYNVHICRREKHTIANTKKEVDYKGNVYSVTVDNGMYISRRNGKISIHGNSNAEAGIYAFLSETIKPKIDKFVDILNQFFVDDFGDDLFLVGVDPTPEDRAKKDDHYVKAHNKWLTTNEIRIAEGYDPIDGGDYIYQGMLSPMGSEVYQPVKIGKGFSAENFYKKQKEEKLREIYRRAMRGRKILRLQENLINKITIEVVDILDKKKEEYTKEQKDKIWEKFSKNLETWEDKWKKLNIQLFQKQKVRALEALKKIKKSNKAKDLGLLDLKKESKIFADKSKPTIKAIVEEAGNSAIKQKSLFNIDDPITAKWIEDKAMKFGEEVNSTTISKLKAELSAGVLEGEGIDKLSERIKGLFEEWYRGRNETIARTEVLSSNNAGTMFGYKQSGIVKKKEWLATRDSRTRDTHAEMDGEQVAVNKKFSNGLDFPGDPNGDPGEIINCRCTTIPIV